MTRCRRPLGLVLALILLAAPLAWDRWWVPRAEAQLYQLGGTLQSAATATGNGSTLDTSLTSIVAFQVTSGAASVVPEGSLDGATWATLTCYALGSSTAVTTFTTTGLWRCNTIGIPVVRARIAVYTSGSVTVRAQAVASYFNLGTTVP